MAIAFDNIRGSAAAELDIRTVSSFDFGSSEYADLHARSSATAFQHPLWLTAFYDVIVPRRGAEPCIATGRDPASGKLEFVLPLILRRKTGATLLETTDLGVGDYAAPIVSRTLSLRQAPADQVRSILPQFDILRIRPVREDHVSEWSYFIGGEPRILEFSAHAVRLSGDHEGWRSQTYGESFRKMLDRKSRRFFRENGARVRLLTDPVEIAEAIASIRGMRAGRFVGDLIQTDFVADFYRRIAVEGHEAGIARTYRIETREGVIGHAFGTVLGGRFNYLLVGCDYETHGRHSPGLILYDRMIADWMDAGGKTFDFTIGDEPFKSDFGTSPTAMHEIVDTGSWRGRLALAAFDARTRFRRSRNAGQ